MDEVLKHLSNIYATDWATLAVIGLLCVVASYALKEYLASPIFVIFVFPVLFVLSLVAQYLFTIGEFYVVRKTDQWLTWTIIASICGNVVGIALVGGFGRLRGYIATTHNQR